MKILAVIVSLFLPGIGTMIVGRIGLGVIQFILTLLAGIIAFVPIIGWIVGGAIYAIIWIWALISVVTTEI